MSSPLPSRSDAPARRRRLAGRRGVSSVLLAALLGAGLVSSASLLSSGAVASATGRLPTTAPISTPPGVPAPIKFDGSIAAIQREGSGLRLALVTDDGGAAILHLDAAGRERSREPVTLPQQIAHYETEDVVLTPGGAVALLVGGENEDVDLQVATRDRGTNRIQQITPAGNQAFPQAPLVVGPTGAMGFGYFEDLPGRRAILKMAFRPAGATNFRRPVTVGAPHHGTDEMKIVMGPNGGGAVFSLPDIQDKGQRPTSIRRITPGGQVGPVIRVPINVPRARQWLVSADAAFRRDGTLFASFIADTTEDTATWFAALGPHATSLSTVQRLSRGGVDVGLRDIKPVFVDRSGRVNLLAERNTRGPATTLFTGTTKGVRRVRAFAPAFADSVKLDDLPDGRLIAVWDAATLDKRPGIVAAIRRANGTFSPATRLPGSPTNPDEIATLTGFAALSGGRIAVTWASPEDRASAPPDSLLIVPAPGD